MNMSIFEWLCAASFVGVGLFFLLCLATALTGSYPLKSHFANSGLLVLGIGFLLGAIGLFGTAVTVVNGGAYGAMSLFALYLGASNCYTAIRNFREDARLRRKIDDDK